MHPAGWAFVVAAALAGAATVPLIWWLGLRAIIAVQHAQARIERAELAVRIDALEVMTERLASRRASEDGQKGREKQRATKAAAEAELESLQAAARAAIESDLGKSPPLRKPLRSVAAGAAAPSERDVVEE